MEEQDIQPRSSEDVIVAVVIELLETEGYDAVQVRTVARRARVSLATMYRFFPTRDELVVVALMRWMDANVYSHLVHPAPDSSLHDGLMSLYRQLFEPWVRHPRVLEAYHRARSVPGGEHLDAQGLAVMRPIANDVMATADPAYVEDLGLILNHIFYAVIGRFADGQLAITDILTVLDRTLFRLTSDNVSAALTKGESTVALRGRAHD